MSTSCCHKVFIPSVMKSHYDNRMTSKSELKIKNSIKILSEQETKDLSYEILSYNNYKPFSIPFFRNYKRQMTKKAYQRMVEKAHEEGGNAVIVVGFGNTWAGGASFQVVKIK